MSNYWVNYWNDIEENLNFKDDQSKVLRTLNKNPIDNKTWELTLELLNKQLKPKETDEVLELCCGNGLISDYISKKTNKVTAVDVSKSLINDLKNKKNKKIVTIHEDIRHISFNQKEFDIVIIYAGIQYLSKPESIKLFKNVYRWLKPNGIFYIGDIPDKDKIWDFYNSDFRESVFFNNHEKKEDIIGTWFEKSFLEKLSKHSGYNNFKTLEQDSRLIYSNFRYDFIAYKGERNEK